MSRAFVSVGSNIRPDENVRRAVRLLANAASVVAVSTVYETEPEGRPEQQSYYNCVVEVETEAQPSALKQELLAIEERLGRRRGDDKYAPRTIDLDLLVYDDLVVRSAELTLPDPDIGRRPYLAAALRELAPALTLPGSGVTIAEIAAGVGRKGLRPLDEYTMALRREIAHGQKRRENRRSGPAASG